MSTCRVSRITRLVDSLIGTCTVTALGHGLLNRLKALLQVTAEFSGLYESQKAVRFVASFISRTHIPLRRRTPNLEALFFFIPENG
jgi:hypothetical protein